jgi:hypothetical protein
MGAVMYGDHRGRRTPLHCAVGLTLFVATAVAVSVPAPHTDAAAGESIRPLTPSRLLETRVGDDNRTADGRDEGEIGRAHV